jgi:iron complex transport system permease protein
MEIMSSWTFKRWLFWILFLAAILMVVAAVGVTVGAVWIPLGKSGSVLLHSFLGRGGSPEGMDREAAILMELRVPRVVAGALVGAALALCGAALQALLRNPLADPYILGISSGAALGAVLAILFGLGSIALGAYAVPAAAFSGALLTLLFVYFLARVQGRVPAQTMLLAGFIVSAFFLAIIMFLISWTSDERLFQVTFWLMGNLEYMAAKPLGGISLYLLIGSAVLFSRAKDLNLASLGEETASELGVEVESLKKITFIFASLITGAVVSVSGLIGFVGLVVPHLVRMIWGPDHRFLLPASALAGAILLVLADTVARTALAPSEIPVGVITALGGAPFFVYLLRRRGLGGNS